LDHGVDRNSVAKCNITPEAISFSSHPVRVDELNELGLMWVEWGACGNEIKVIPGF